MGKYRSSGNSAGGAIMSGIFALMMLFIALQVGQSVIPASVPASSNTTIFSSAYDFVGITKGPAAAPVVTVNNSILGVLGLIGVAAVFMGVLKGVGFRY